MNFDDQDYSGNQTIYYVSGGRWNGYAQEIVAVMVMYGGKLLQIHYQIT